MAAANAEDREPFLGLNEEEEEFTKKLTVKVVLSAVTYPLSCVKTLIQLGHEPFALSTGRTLVVAGRNAYFLPNAFSYGKQLATQQGAAILYTGLDSACAAMVANGIASYVLEKYLDKHYPDVGGPDKYGKDVEEKDLDDQQSFQRRLRFAIRESFVRVGATIVSRPFTVIAVRQVAQIIGKEIKYTNVFSSLKVIGQEEGPAGLLSGLVPQIMGELVIVWGVHSLTYLGERALKNFGFYEKDDDKDKKEVKEIRNFMHFAIPFVVNSWAYPYTVVSTVMAVAGSGLAVSFLPYSPSFNVWQNAYDYLRPHGLKRASRLFLREQTGAVSVGPDQQLYASTKHFV